MTPSSDVDGGWAWVVLIASFLIHILSYGMAWSTGVYNVIFLEVFNQSKANTAWVGALPTAVMYAIGPLASMLSNRFGQRPVIMCGGVLASAGLALSFFAPNLYYLYFTFGVMMGAGLGIVYIPSIDVISCYFERRIAIAAGIATSGIGMGNFIYPGLMRALITWYGWRGSLLILSGITLNICVLGAFIRPHTSVKVYKDRPILDISPFRKRSYQMLCLNNFLFCCGLSAVYIHLTAHAQRQGIDPDLSASLVSGLGIANLVSRLVYGFIANNKHFNPFVLFGVSFALSGVCICLIPAFSSYAALMVCAVLFGVFSGCFGCLLVVILKTLLGRQRFANGLGCVLLSEAAGTLAGGWVTGVIFDVTKSYTVAFLCGGGLSIASGLVMIHPFLYDRRRRKQLDHERPDLKIALDSSEPMTVLVSTERLDSSIERNGKPIGHVLVPVENGKPPEEQRSDPEQRGLLQNCQNTMTT